MGLVDKTQIARYLAEDIKHLAVNLNLNLITPIIFYVFEGFEKYGWSHLAFLIPYAVWIYTLDDAIESRRFPIYVWPLIAASFILQPFITLFVILGEILINLKAIFRKESFILEQFEGPGNMLIYVAPYIIPLNIWEWKLWLAIMAFVTYINAVGHKIGHMETEKPKLSFIWGIFLATVVGILYGRWDYWFTWLYFFLSIATMPFIFLKKDYVYRKYIGYNLIFQSVMGPLGFIYLVQVII